MIYLVCLDLHFSCVKFDIIFAPHFISSWPYIHNFFFLFLKCQQINKSQLSFSAPYHVPTGYNSCASISYSGVFLYIFRPSLGPLFSNH